MAQPTTITMSDAEIAQHSRAMDIFEHKLVLESVRFGECYTDFNETRELHNELRRGFLDRSSKVKGIAYTFQLTSPLSKEDQTSINLYRAALHRKFGVRPEKIFLVETAQTEDKPALHTYTVRFPTEDYQSVKNLLNWWFPAQKAAASLSAAKQQVADKVAAPQRDAKKKTVRKDPDKTKGNNR